MKEENLKNDSVKDKKTMPAVKVDFDDVIKDALAAARVELEANIEFAEQIKQGALTAPSFRF